MSRGFQVPGDLALADDERTLVLWQGAEEVAERIAVGLQTFAGTWTYDLRYGMRYLYEILEKPSEVGLALLRAEIWRMIGGTPGVTSVTAVQLDYRPEMREVTVSWQAKTDAGPTTGSVVIR
jgi:hypothetical protein